MTEQSANRVNVPRWAWWAGGGVVVLVLAWLIFSPGGGRVRAPSTARIARGDMEVSVIAPGRIRAAQAVDIKVPNSAEGELQLVYLVPEGTVVEPGQLVARLDSTSAVERLETAFDELETAEAEYAQLLVDQRNQILDMENAVRSAELSYRQAEMRLQALEFSSELEQQQGQLDLENSRISRDEASRKLEAQKIINEASRFFEEISLNRSREEYEDVQQELKDLTILAPMSGMIIHAETGRFFERTKVREGDTVRRGQTLAQLPDLTRLQALVMINELDGKRVQEGQPAHVRLESYPRETFEGTVSDMSTLAQQTEDRSNVRIFQAVIDLNEPDPRVRPGMTASAEIVVEVLEDVLKMPLSACGVTSGRCLVMRVGDEEPVPVTLGLRNESEAEVLDGLQEGDRIRLGWLEEPGHMISVLAGNQPLPEDVSEAILSEGEDYGTRTMPIVIPPSGTGAEGTEPGGATGREGSRSDPSRIAAEVEAQREQIRQQMETAGEQPSGRSGMRAAPDSTQLANLRRRAEALPEGLRAELLQFVEGGGSDVRSLSQALRDSLRAWGIFGGGRGSRGGGEIPPSGEEISPVNSESSGGIPPGQGVIER